MQTDNNKTGFAYKDGVGTTKKNLLKSTLKTKFLYKKAYPHISSIIGISFLLRFTFFGVCHLFHLSPFLQSHLCSNKLVLHITNITLSAPIFAHLCLSFPSPSFLTFFPISLTPLILLPSFFLFPSFVLCF